MRARVYGNSTPTLTGDVEDRHGESHSRQGMEQCTPYICFGLNHQRQDRAKAIQTTCDVHHKHRCIRRCRSCEGSQREVDTMPSVGKDYYASQDVDPATIMSERDRLQGAPTQRSNQQRLQRNGWDEICVRGNSLTSRIPDDIQNLNQTTKSDSRIAMNKTTHLLPRYRWPSHRE